MRSIEVVAILAVLIPPSYYAFWIFLTIFKAFMAFEATVLTSPFF